MIKELTIPTLRRLPSYYKIVCQAVKAGEKYISSPTIAKILNIDDSQIRKDISATGYIGKPKVGFETKTLKRHLEDFLGFNNTREAFLVGAGNLGLALAKYDGFKNYGLKIHALFDNDPHKVGIKIADKEVFHISKLPDLVSRMHIQIAILAVNGEQAQEVANFLVKSGIKAIWNYAPVTLQTAEDVLIWDEDIGSSYVVFSQVIAQRFGDQ